VGFAGEKEKRGREKSEGDKREEEKSQRRE